MRDAGQKAEVVQNCCETLQPLAVTVRPFDRMEKRLAIKSRNSASTWETQITQIHSILAARLQVQDETW